jgi:hypothetical protein
MAPPNESNILNAFQVLQPYLSPQLLQKLQEEIHLAEKAVQYKLHIKPNYTIWITKDGLEKEIKLFPLNKAVYFLFLRHPEGIRVKCLCDYAEELAELYGLINHHATSETALGIARSICDCSQPYIHQQVSKIKAAFRKLLPERIATNFYVQGVNGEPKKINLLPEALEDEAGIIFHKVNRSQR